MAPDGKVRFVIVPVVVVVKAAAVFVVRYGIALRMLYHALLTGSSLENKLLPQVKNSTSLTANTRLLLYLYISTLLVLKLTVMLTLLRPGSSLSGEIEARG